MLYEVITGMHAVDAHPERVVFFQYGDQLRGNPLGQDKGCLGADTDQLDMGDVSQFIEEPIQRGITQGERITAGDKDVPYGAVASSYNFV